MFVSIRECYPDIVVASLIQYVHCTPHIEGEMLRQQEEKREKKTPYQCSYEWYRKRSAGPKIIRNP